MAAFRQGTDREASNKSCHPEEGVLRPTKDLMPACGATGTKRSSHDSLVEDFDVVSADYAGRSVEEFERLSGLALQSRRNPSAQVGSRPQ